MSSSVYGYEEFNSAVKTNSAETSSVKVGYFKLAEDGSEALVRFNVSSVEDLQFSTVHVINAGANKWLKVSCLNPLSVYNEDCPLCKASVNNSAISKASKKLFLQAIVSYKDTATGAWSTAQPVIWERPAGFSREIANALRDYGNLKEVLFKVTRCGAKGDMKTTYALNYAVPTVFKPEMVPADFSAFNSFNIAKHSYWEKTAEEINTFLQTGKFPEVASTKQTEAAPTQAQAAQQQTPPWAAPVQQQPVQQQPAANYNAGAYTPVDVTPAAPAANTERSSFTTQYSF